MCNLLIQVNLCTIYKHSEPIAKIFLNTVMRKAQLAKEKQKLKDVTRQKTKIG